MARREERRAVQARNNIRYHSESSIPGSLPSALFVRCFHTKTFQLFCETLNRCGEKAGGCASVCVCGFVKTMRFIHVRPICILYTIGIQLNCLIRQSDEKACVCVCLFVNGGLRSQESGKHSFNFCLTTHKTNVYHPPTELPSTHTTR